MLRYIQYTHIAMNTPCPICGDTSAGVQTTQLERFVTCPCCGQFGISQNFEFIDGRFSIDGNVRNRMKHLLCERRVRKLGMITLVDKTHTTERKHPSISVDEFLASYPRTPLDYFDRALENLSELLNHPIATAVFRPQDRACVFAEGNHAYEMLKRLEELGYIAVTNNSLISLKPKGWARVAELQHPGRNSKQAFVAMWFDDSMTLFYENGFKPAIEADCLVKALRIDRKEHNNRIDDEIIAEIRWSRYLVADFTGHRAGVYMEAGFALGLGLPVIWCVSDKEKDEPHFDARQFNRIIYSSAEDLRAKLLNRIRATVV